MNTKDWKDLQIYVLCRVGFGRYGILRTNSYLGEASHEASASNGRAIHNEYYVGDSRLHNDAVPR